MTLLMIAALAAPPPSLFADDGWAPYAERRGVTVQKKHIPEVGMSAFRGSYTLPSGCEPDALFTVINDIEGALAIGDRLDESVLLERDGGDMVYYQVLADPFGPVAARWWLNHSRLERGVDGEEGRLRRSWWPTAPSNWAEARAGIRQRHPDAVEVTGTWGAWELVPDGPTLVYTVATDPGGRLPDGLFTRVSGRTLPDNMLDFVEVACPG